MKFLIIVFLFTFSNSLWAEETVVKDPNNIFLKVDEFLNRQDFSETFKCDTKARFFYPVRSVQLACSEDGCGGIYQTDDSFEVENTVSNCTESSVSIYGSDGRIWDILNSSFQAHNKNIARLFLNNLSNYVGYEGDVTVVSADAAKYTLPTGVSLEAMNVNFKFHLKGAPYSFQGLMTVLKNGSGVSQVARFRLEAQTWFRLKQF